MARKHVDPYLEEAVWVMLCRASIILGRSASDLLEEIIKKWLDENYAVLITLPTSDIPITKKRKSQKTIE